MSSTELTLLATTMAIAMSRGKTECEVRAILNLINMIEDLLIGILAQKDICNKSVSDFIF